MSNKIIPPVLKVNHKSFEVRSSRWKLHYAWLSQQKVHIAWILSDWSLKFMIILIWSTILYITYHPLHGSTPTIGCQGASEWQRIIFGQSESVTRILPYSTPVWLLVGINIKGMHIYIYLYMTYLFFQSRAPQGAVWKCIQILYIYIYMYK